MALHIYTDGSCLGNPGPGGWAALILYGDKQFHIEGGEPYTTNNRMELTAVIEALKFIDAELSHITEMKVFSDSNWVVSTMTKNWKRKKNLDLWEKLLPLLLEKHVDWQWVKAHAGHPENEDCDARAFAEAKKQEKIARNMPADKLKLPGDAPTLF